MRAAIGGVLALDLSTSVGWCYGTRGEAPLLGVWKLPADQDFGRRFAAFQNELLDAIDLLRPGSVVAEAPFFTGRPGSAFTLHLQVGLTAIAEAACYQHSLPPLRLLAASTARAKVLGNGRIPGAEVKQAAIAWCRARDIEPADHNAADAAVLWAHEVGIRAPGREDVPFAKRARRAP